MMSLSRFLSRFFARTPAGEAPSRQPRYSPPPDRSARHAEALTLAEQALFNKGFCPDCGTGVVGGPRGGMSQNFACPGCGSEYNSHMGLRVDRNSDRGFPDVGRLRAVFGIDPGLLTAVAPGRDRLH